LTSEPPAPPARARSSWWLLGVLAAVIAVAVVVAVVSAGDDDTRVDTGASSPALDGGGFGGVQTAPAPGQAVTTAPVTVEGTPLPSLPGGGSDPAVGRPFPTLSGSAVLDGSPLRITNNGRPKLVLYLAHWCPHCQAEVPRVQDWIDGGGKPAGVDLFAVSTAVRSDRDNFPPAEWLQDEGWTAPTLADSDEMAAARAAGLTGYPFFVAVDRQGRVVERASGEQSIEDIEELVGRLAG
jgi:cytochrome c biogenesis protein CcmG/thiol:disulfide interchange protein DsbE